MVTRRQEKEIIRVYKVSGRSLSDLQIARQIEGIAPADVYKIRKKNGELTLEETAHLLVVRRGLIIGGLILGIGVTAGLGGHLLTRPASYEDATPSRFRN